MRTCIFILGMHRSGTSALTGMLHKLGLSIGKTIMPSAYDNPKGFFENLEVLKINNAILEAIGHKWDSTKSVSQNDLEALDQNTFFNQISTLIQQEFDGCTNFLIKDPRLCLVLPVWLKAFEQLNIDSQFLIINRHPREVALSLEKRNGFSYQKSYLLWLEHIFNAEKYTQQAHRVFLTFENLIEDTEKVISLIRKRLGLTLQVPMNGKKQDLDAFLDRSLKHFNEEGAEEIPFVCSKLYELMQKMTKARTNKKKIADSVDELRSVFKDSVRSEVDSHQDAKKEIYAQLFLDLGEGYHEDNSIKIPINSETKRLEFNISSYNSIKEVRFDPANCPVFFELGKVSLINKESSQEVPLTGVHVLVQNDNQFLYDHGDPNMFFDGEFSFDNVDKIVIELNVLALDLHAYPHILRVFEQSSSKIQEEKFYLNEALSNKDHEIANAHQKVQEQQNIVHEQQSLIENLQEQVAQQSATPSVPINHDFVTQLQEQLSMKDQLILEKESRLRDQEELLRNRESVIQGYIHKLEAQASLISEKENLVKEVKNIYQSQTSQVTNFTETLNKQIEKLRQENDRLYQEKSEAFLSSKELLLQIKTLQHEINHHELEKNSFASKLQNKEQNFEDLKQKLNQKEQQVSNLEQSRNQLQNRLQEQQTKLNTHAQQVEAKNQALQQKEAQHNQLKQQFNSKTNQLAEFETQNNFLKQQAQQLESQLSNSKQQLELKVGELNELNLQNEKSTEKLKTLENILSSVEEKLGHRENQIQNLQTQNQNLNKEIEEQKVNEKLAASQSQMEAFKLGNIQDLKATNDSLLSKIDERHEEIQILRENNGSLTATIAVLEKENEELKSKLSGINQDLDLLNESKTKLNVQLEQIRSENDNLTNAVKEAYNYIQVLDEKQKKFESIEKEIQRLQNKEQEYTKQILELAENSKQNQLKVEDYKQQVEQAQQQKAEILNQVKELQQQKNTSEEEKQQQQAALEQLQQQQAALENHINALSQEKNYIEIEKSRIDSQLHLSQGNVEELKEQIKAQKVHSSELEKIVKVYVDSSDERMSIINDIRDSLSYKVGFGITSPVRWVADKLSKKDNSNVTTNTPIVDNDSNGHLNGTSNPVNNIIQEPSSEVPEVIEKVEEKQITEEIQLPAEPHVVPEPPQETVEENTPQNEPAAEASTSKWIDLIDPNDVQAKADAKLIEESGLLDLEWYLKQNTDVSEAGINPYEHYLMYGAPEGRNPNPHFYTKYYLSLIEANTAEDVNPLLHYIKEGKEAGMSTSPGALVIAPTLPSGRFYGSYDQKKDQPGKIGIMAHIFYTDMCKLFMPYFQNMPYVYDLLISTDTEEKKTEIEKAFKSLSNCENVIVKVVTNRGRDIAPMLISFKQECQERDYILHVHSKKSPYGSVTSGWFEHCMEHLLASQIYISSIFQNFKDQEELGVVYPPAFPGLISHVAWGKMLPKAKETLNKIGVGEETLKRFPLNFPAGSMMWFKTKALKPLFDTNFQLEDFPEEAGQQDNTLAHVIERLFFYVADSQGYGFQAYRPAAENEYFQPRIIASPAAGREFRKTKKPLVSIIIPVYNQWEYTSACLATIADYTNFEKYPYEVIIADDGSTDETVNVEKIFPNVKVIKTPKNLGFLGNCNNASKYCKGKYILFLNNDTQVQTNWLGSLVKLIERDSKVGMVGSKLVYPDGTLQEAGGIIWKDASGANFGRNQDPAEPSYNYVKEVDYVSGAAIMLRKSFWEKVGRFDEVFIPAYYEDTDMAFQVRDNGLKVCLQPASLVVHFEGKSHGTDTSSGIKKHQVINHEKFLGKWNNVLQTNHCDNIEWKNARERSKDKKVVAILDYYLPEYDRHAGARHTWDYILLLVKKGYIVKYLACVVENERQLTFARELEQLGVETFYPSSIFYEQNWSDWLRENGDYLDAVIINRPHVARLHLTACKESNIPTLYFCHDLHTVRERREAIRKNDQALLDKVNASEFYEREVFERMDYSYTPSTFEEAYVKENYNLDNITYIPLYLINKTLKKRKYMPKGYNVVFVGGMRHTPNIDGVMWFLDNVWDKVVEKIPTAKFHVIGSNPSDELLERANSNLIVHGAVSEERLDELYKKAKAVVVPLLYGAGVKGKTVESLKMGIPLISTSIGLEGIPEVTDIIKPSDTPEDYLKSTLKMLKLRDYEWKKLSAKMQSNAKANFSESAGWHYISKGLEAVGVGLEKKVEITNV